MGICIFWQRMRDSKWPLKFFCVVKAALGLHYFQSMALLSPINLIFVIVHFLVREKIRENIHRRCFSAIHIAIPDQREPPHW